MHQDMFYVKCSHIIETFNGRNSKYIFAVRCQNIRGEAIHIRFFTETVAVLAKEGGQEILSF